jgi:hypothetical protein
VNSVPNAALSLVSTAGGEAIIQATPAGASYQWLFQNSPNGSYTATSTTTQSDTVACGDVGEYHTVVVTQNGCSDTSNQLLVVCVGINEIQQNVLNVALQPNPAKDQLQLIYELKENSSIQILVSDIAGRRATVVNNVAKAKGANKELIDVSALSQGIYTLSIVSNNGSYNAKFVKE